ncbi:MAG: DUF3098 domain-containing protein [Melioribacteraceae bacterium]|nr:DUF3098 domain-containing protein [Melioribacteraceae bacterium]MCF8356435.1 DUF3098 domain-containing protein [Melioribacteraceae bacterium]MCF8394872.1 DUF3098 domain-containing protein [Melioribacteraceae bacterium]MCF8420600.1 DUF3098 domain-containing protein [Melioribacteraceae bacterium]
MSKSKRKIRAQKTKLQSPFKDYFDKSNYILLATGVVIVIIGFFLMAQGPWDNPVSMTISPLVLLVAYLIIFPLSIMYKKKRTGSKENVSSES